MADIVTTFDFEASDHGVLATAKRAAATSLTPAPADFLVPGTGTNGLVNRKTGAAPSSGVGPDGAKSGSYYLYVETTSQILGDRWFVLLPGTFDAGRGEGIELNYWYMQRAGDAPLMQWQYLPDGADDTTGWVNLKTITGPTVALSASAVWSEDTFNTKDLGITTGNIKLRWYWEISATGTFWHNDQALDDLVITEKESAGVNLVVDDISSPSDTSQGTISIEWNLSADDVSSATDESEPAISINWNLVADDVEVQSALSEPAISIQWSLTVNNLASATDVESLTIEFTEITIIDAPNYTWETADFTWQDLEANSIWASVQSIETVAISDVRIDSGEITLAQFAEAAKRKGPVGFSDFNTFIPGDYQVKKGLVRLTVESISDARPRIDDLTFTVDMEDVRDKGRATLLAATTTISFSRTFAIVPEVYAVAVGGVVVSIAQILAVSKTGFDVRLVDKDNNLVAGDISWISEGY